MIVVLRAKTETAARILNLPQQIHLLKRFVMNGKKLLYLLVAGLALSGASCQHEPSLSDYNSDYTVYTNGDAKTDFAAFSTYYLPDQILLIGNTSSNEARYWTDNDALMIIGTVADRLDMAGYERSTDKESATFGMQLSYVEQVTYYAGYNDPYWWWNYPYYWSPGYWGGWNGWYYPYYVQYGYTSGSLLIEMVDLEAPQEGANTKLPVVWSAYIGGLLSSSKQLNMQRTITAVEQAFMQSSYLGTSGTAGR